jgi:hypothetical protein
MCRMCGRSWWRGRSRLSCSCEIFVFSRRQYRFRSMATCTVRYPKRSLIIPAIWFAISFMGLVMASLGRGHWTAMRALLFFAVGIFSLAYFGLSRTVFSEHDIEQRNFYGRVCRFTYDDIQYIKLFGKTGRALMLTLGDGAEKRVHGDIGQLINAQVFLREKLPRAFEDGPGNYFPH